MSGKVCIVTGANSGHGYGVALGLARQGAQLILVCRNQSKGEAAQAALAAATGQSAIDLLTADLASLADVRRLAGTIKARYGRVEVLVNNAGVYKKNLTLTVDGLEETFAVNYLAHFLLTCELSELLKQSAPARVVNVTSSVHKQSRLDLTTVLRPPQYDGARAYADSKLAIVAGTLTFAEQLAGTGVTVNCLTPGAVRTEIIRDFKVARFFWKLIGPILPDSERGARPAVRLALSPNLDGVTGKYFEKLQEARPGRLAQQADFRRELWEWSKALVEPA